MVYYSMMSFKHYDFEIEKYRFSRFEKVIEKKIFFFVQK